MNEQYIDTIHRYLNGALDEPEHEAFEANLRSNHNLQNDVELERLLLAGLERSGEIKLRQTIGSVHQQLKSAGFFEAATDPVSTPLFTLHYSKMPIMKRILAIAASLVFLAAVAWFFKNQTPAMDTNALFAQYYQPQTEAQRAQKIMATLESHGLAGVQSDTDTLLQALQLYEAARYDESIALLSSLFRDHPDNDIAQYYLGVIHMSQERYAKAIELLLPLSRSATSELKNDALWNLGLCYLKAENAREDARAAFTKLSNDNDYPNHRGAKAVLEQLIQK